MNDIKTTGDTFVQQESACAKALYSKFVTFFRREKRKYLERVRDYQVLPLILFQQLRLVGLVEVVL